MSKKKAVFIALIVALLVLVAGLLYFFSSKFLLPQQIQLVNSSNTYTVRYNRGSQLEKDFTAWGVWKKNGVFLETDGKRHTLTHIVIQTTDAVQPYYRLDTKVNGDITSSIDESIDEAGVYRLTLYINPKSIASHSADDVSDMFTFAVLSRFYDMTHFSEAKNAKFQAVFAALKKYTTSERKTFLITKT